MNNYFRSFWSGLIVIAMGALAVLFGAGVWFMIGIGLMPALGLLASYGLAFLVAPIVAALSMTMFIYGETLKKHILDWEYQYGSEEVRDEEGAFLHYQNKRSYSGWITAIKWFTLIMDSAGIIYRIIIEPIGWPGRVLLFVVLELLAFLPWPVGRIMYMVANRPAAAVRREVNEIINVADAHSRLQAANEALKKKKVKVPPHMRPALPAPTEEQVFISAHEDTANSSSGKNGQK